MSVPVPTFVSIFDFACLSGLCTYLSLSLSLQTLLCKHPRVSSKAASVCQMELQRRSVTGTKHTSTVRMDPLNMLVKLTCLSSSSSDVLSAEGVASDGA